MKKAKSTSDELRAEYKRSDFKKLERGKYYERIKASSNVVVLDPEVAAVFPNSAAVNKALHSLVEVAETSKHEDRMTEKQPPEWGNDPLSRFFSEAEYNDRAAAVNYASIYALVQHVHATFLRVAEAIEKDDRPDLLVSRFLMVRTHSAFLGAVRLAMSGQVSESFPVLRSAIEHAWYALHIAKDPKDPKAPERANLWLSRNDDQSSKARCKSEFTVTNVRSTHEGLDAATAKELRGIYENLIDFGAHPNPGGVLTSMKFETEKQINNFKVGILFPDKTVVAFGLHMAVAVAVGALKVFRLIYPERFSIAEIDLEVDMLVVRLNTVFKPWVPASSTDSM